MNVCDICGGEHSEIVCPSCYPNGPECIERGSPESPCRGPVEARWPGYGHRSFYRCERHGNARVKREEAAVRRYNPRGRVGGLTHTGRY